ncbi:PAS domain S-box-containing protein [Mariprofundus ferrinatatus]|uniref:PAS domain S-box-containing protein n=1 Tax=Mariprofundus ferrinatatus TaxID=1921087 RepID=A0A2K8L926_9PROT|nr:PAS domain S-box protein [Mariprofundus ferrinatatus]ATX82391.1 PAS domain S-box-containing protein [Mariprofundus ferrinatatus]
MLQRIGFSGLGVILAVLFWPAEALLHVIVYGDESFLENLLSGDANETWMRLMISSTLIGFGFFAQRAFGRQKSLQTRLQKKSERLQEIIDRSYDAYVSADEGGNIIEWNRSAEILFGWPRQKIIGKPLETIIPERMREEHRRGMRQYLENNIGSWLYKPMRTQALHRDGFEFNVEMVVTPLNSEGSIEFFAFIREQTD